MQALLHVLSEQQEKLLSDLPVGSMLWWKEADLKVTFNKFNFLIRKRVIVLSAIFVTYNSQTGFLSSRFSLAPLPSAKVYQTLWPTSRALHTWPGLLVQLPLTPHP